VVADGITTYKSNPYGAKSLEFATQGVVIVNNRIYKPLSPYLATPYSYVAPYVAKIDSLGDSGLTTLETKFPFIKEDTAALKEKTMSYATYPTTVLNDNTKVFRETYNERYQHHEGKNPLFRLGFTMLDTGVKIGGDIFHFVAGKIHTYTADFEKKTTAKQAEKTG